MATRCTHLEVLLALVHVSLSGDDTCTTSSEVPSATPFGRRLLSSAASPAGSKVFPAPLYFNQCARIVSPWHDIPLRLPHNANPAILNYVCEIPRGTRPKFEIDTERPFNPIVQDKNKDGTPRDYKLDSLTNYGALAQTYEDPLHKDAWTGLLGDGDPVDVCEIGSRLASTGDAYQVKVLGALAMIDGGETDWKLLAIRTDDPLAAALSDVESPTTPDAVRKAMDEIRHWFRVYKVPEGKGENDFAFEGRWLGLGTTLEIIASTHDQWKALVAAQPKGKKAPWVPKGDFPLGSALDASKDAVLREVTVTTQPPLQ